MAATQRRAEMDVAHRLRMDELREQLPSFMISRMKGGSGFPITETLRQFFFEYGSRLRDSGFFSFPTSFNVVESFLTFSDRFLAYDMREEREHLLFLHQYIDWYTASKFPDKPLALTDILQQGVVYEYHMASPLIDFAVETIDSKLRILGVALVRHGDELSGMILAGESPPYPPDSELTLRMEDFVATPDREHIKPAPSFSLKDRYVAELPDHSRVILLARFDLARSRYDVRYVNLDIGTAYLVFTDDVTIFEGQSDRDAKIAKMAEPLDRYSGLFSALASFVYLPAFFIDQAAHVVETKFATALHTDIDRRPINKALKRLGSAQVCFFRKVKCLTSDPPELAEETRTIRPPDMEFQTSGYWKPLEPGTIGEAKDGTPVVGKTWVERTDTWLAHSLDTFILSKERGVLIGKDPGWIYVMRSGSHYDDLYKIGLTRRSCETRAAELGMATGVPTGFDVLGKWEVPDCTTAEAEIHKRLRPFRVNKRREFFRANLQMVIAIINEEISKLK